MNKSNKRFRSLSILTLAAVLAMGNALILPQLPNKVAAAESTLLKNGSFEQYTGTNGVANEWTLVAPDAQSTALSVVTSPVEEGMKAQKFSASGLPSGHYADLNQTITNVAPNAQYLVEGRFYVESLDNAQVELYIDYFDANKNIVGSAKTVQKTVTEGYVKLENTRITPPGTASMRVYALLRATGDNGSGTFYVDHMRAVQVAQLTPVLDNPGFERYTGTMEGVADGWSTWQDPAAVSAFSVVNAPVAEGSRAQRVSASNLPSYGAVDVYQAYDVLGNVSYTVTGKFLIEELNNAKVQLYVDYYDVNGDSIKIAAVDYWQTTDGYIELKHEGFTPSNTAYMRVYAVLRGITEGSSGSFYVDDMQVQRTSNDLIPKMISNKLPTGVVLPTTEQLWYEGYKAFDENPATAWKSQNNIGNMLEYNFETGTVVTSYSVQAVSAETAPKYWSFQAFGPSGWYNLHEGSATDWQPGMVKTFSFDNRSAYKNYRLYVSQANGGAYYEIAEVEMKGYYAKPEKPWGVNLAKAGDGYVTLNWKPINGVQGYNIYQGTEKINSAPITSTTYTIGGLTNLTTYSYQISAVNQAGESVKSDIVQAVPYAESAIPAMTSNTTPYGSLKFSHFTPGHDGFHAFDRDPGTYWETTVDYPNKSQFVEYTFPRQYEIKGVTITPVTSSSGPRAIYFSRSGPSGMGTFYDVYITDWQAGVPKTIIFPSAQTAETFRIVMFPHIDDWSMKISELEFIGQPK